MDRLKQNNITDRQMFLESIKKDTQFLMENSLMDYSLILILSIDSYKKYLMYCNHGELEKALIKTDRES